MTQPGRLSGRSRPDGGSIETLYGESEAIEVERKTTTPPRRTWALPVLPAGYPDRQELRRLLKQHSISNKELAEMSGVDERTVRRWLQNQDQPGHRFPPRMLWWLILEIKKRAEPRRVGM